MARLIFEPAIAFCLIIANARINVKLNFFIVFYIPNNNLCYHWIFKFSHVFQSIFCQYFLILWSIYVFSLNRMCVPKLY